METAVLTRPPLTEPRNIQREVLPNGLIVLSEEMAHIRSIAIGIWMKTGSRDESPELNDYLADLNHGKRVIFAGSFTP